MKMKVKIKQDWQDEEEKTLPIKGGSHWVADTVTLGLGGSREMNPSTDPMGIKAQKDAE